MHNESNIRRDKHYIFKLHVHWDFVTKSRRRVFDARAVDVPRGVFAEVCSDAQATRVQMDGEDDPVRLHVEYPLKLAIRQYIEQQKIPD
jgi:putative transposase